MPDLDDSAAFRRRATKIHRASLVVLAALAFACAGLGHALAGALGLIIGIVAGLALAAGGAVAVTLLWAMSQAELDPLGVFLGLIPEA